MNRRWICTDVWMDILPSFDYAQLGLKMALLSFRFDVLVDKHFGGKSELTIRRKIAIRNKAWTSIKVDEPIPELSVRMIDYKWVHFPLPDRPLPNQIRFKNLLIEYIDHSVITFLHSNKQIWDRSGTELELDVWWSSKTDNQQIWDVFAREIWPIFTTSIRHLYFTHGSYNLDNLLRLISPTLLTDLDQLNSIGSISLLPDVIADDGQNATAGQALSKWLHIPKKNGQPKRLCCIDYPLNLEWINYFKETFLRANTNSVSYKIRFGTDVTTPIEQFELVNERTKEKLTMTKDGDVIGESICLWLLKRCPIIAETATDQKQQQKNENLYHVNGVNFILHGNCIGPLSSPTDQSDEKVFSFPGPSDQRNKKK